MPGQAARLTALLAWTVLSPGCGTAVTGQIQPRHFQFVTVVAQSEPGPGGWRAACVHARIKNGTTGDTSTCIFGVEMPIETSNGPISVSLAQRVSAELANEAAYTTFTAAAKTPVPSTYTLCQGFITAYRLRLGAAIIGARVMATCHPLTVPVTFGVPTP